MIAKGSLKTEMTIPLAWQAAESRTDSTLRGLTGYYFDL